MSFIQIIEVTTDKPEQIEAITVEWAAKTRRKRKTVRAVLTADRDRPNNYIQIVEFGSYQEAMENSSLPETGQFAQQLAELSETPVGFRNLDAVHAYEFD